MNESTIEIEINGRNQQVAADLTISELIEGLDVNPNIVAVEVNQQLIPREKHHETKVHAGDQLEVVSLVGGG